ncbi:prenyltransferase/squalene oxidase repeat-containing protein [Actinosynnema sp. NPDC047251]|uniref:LPXTG-motif cell wall anchor domain-containing protein n=1 Tax=Saccharothrix espanaensis (strain ATCC 51144 / DSM 44229 / JCM 9112 / NBRC 15066 / NRRL 15764) TaxID=1179773 RepID=K0JUC9_SACES|nr:prenyltransferase/squalene oxidase repeat-containing protein [Saccharothrix espanaensis]CCH31450.1 LPXTG-motif cell wall anchor domain-containing protein [Saccharothrix espanaensis DSM 44229]
MPLRRTAVAVAVALSALVAAPAAQAAPVTTKSPAEAAAGWLSGRLVAGERMETEFNGVAYPDHGLTIDALLAFDAAGVAQAGAGKALSWLTAPANVAAYTTDPSASKYAGAHAKLALAVLAQGGDPTSVGGVDLIAGLTALRTASGRFADQSQWGDYSNTFTQSLAVITLARHGDAPANAVTFLAGTACPDGGFPLDIGKPTCTAQADATGMAVQALLAAGNTDTAGDTVTDTAIAAAAKGLDWLVKRQDPADGGFGDDAQGGPGAASNANSTGLAAQALRVGGRTAAADKAAGYLAGLQVGCGDPAAGAIALDAKGFNPAIAVRVTSQAVLGLVGTGLAEISSAGDKPAAPVLECAEPTTTTTEPTTTTTTAPPVEDTTTTTTTTTTTPAAGFVVTGSGTLARTGVEAGPAVLLGALLVLTGGLALVVARRRAAAVRR